MSKLYCENCRNQYNDKNNLPLNLPCNHNICKSCLNKNRNKNLYFCKQCNRNLILSSNVKPNQKILKKLHLKYQNQNKSKIYNNQSNNSSNNENEEDEEQEEENEEQEQEEENEEGEEEEDDIDDEIVEEENSENENDNSEYNDKNKNGNNEKRHSTDKRDSQVRKSILKKKPRFSLNQDDNKNIKKNKIKNKKQKNLNRLPSQDIGTSRVNFTSENTSQNKSSYSKESNNEETEQNEGEEEEEENEENEENEEVENNTNDNGKNSEEKSKKLSSRKGTDYLPSNRNSLNKKKEYKNKNEEDNESIQHSEGNDFCIKHKDKPIEFFCSDCSCAICSLCIYETHNGHKLSLLEDISGIIKKKMGEFFIRIQDIMKVNKDNKFNWQKRKDEVNEFQKQQINIVIKSFKEIINKVEEKKNLIIKEFKNKYNHEFNRFDQIKIAIDNDAKEMEKINNLIENKIKAFNSNTDAKILKEIEKYKKIFRQTGLDCGKLQKNEIAIKSELSIDPAMKPMTVNINGLIELLNKVDPKNICYPKVIGIIKEENDNTSLNQPKNMGKNEYNLKISQSSSFTAMNNNNIMNNYNNYKGIEEKKYQNEMENFYNNKIGLNQSHQSNIKNKFPNKHYIENIPQSTLKHKNYSGNFNNNYRLSQNDFSDSNYGEYGPPNHNRGKFMRQLEMTPTASFVNARRSSKYGQTFKESQNTVLNLPNNNINNNINNNYVNGKNYNGNYTENNQGTGIFKENGFGSRGSDYSNNNYNNNNYPIPNNYYKRQRNNSFGSLNDNNNDSILPRKNMLILKERNPSASLPLKLNEGNAIILPKISPSTNPQNIRNSSKKNTLINLNTINNSDSEKSNLNKDIEDSVYCFGEADYCLKFYLNKLEWELIPYSNQLSRQIGLLRYSGICSLPSYRIIISGGCKKENDEPSNLFFLINSKNINDIKNLKNLPKKKYHHGCIFLNNNIYIIGGYDHYDRNNAIPSTLKTVERYNLSKNQWQNLHGLNEARACFGQCVFNRQIFVFGGLYNSSALQSIERYDEDSNVWSTYHIKLPMKLAKLGIVNIDNKNIFVIGGSDENLVPVNNVFSCRFNSDTDKNVWSIEPEMICPRTTGNTCFLWKRNIFVLGGSSTNFFEKFDFNYKKWETIENFFSVIKSANVETNLVNYSCALNHYSAFP